MFSIAELIRADKTAAMAALAGSHSIETDLKNENRAFSSKAQILLRICGRRE